MRRPKTIEKFIRECFESLAIDYKEYFYYSYDDGQYEDISWTDEHGKINVAAVKHASRILGISVDDLLAANEDALTKWERKYRYFWDLDPLHTAYEASLHGDEFEAIRTFEILFNVKTPELYTDRYNVDDVVRRLISQLKEYDKALPGTFHHGANITNLTVDTANFCHFEEIKEMTVCYLEMAERVIELFIQAVTADLVEDEINEYNLLVSVFGLRDRYYTRGYLYYDYLIKARELYADVTRDNIFNSIILKKGLDFKPWQCAEFIDDSELVKKYASVFPQAKAEMRNYAMRTAHFTCDFVWSDAKPIELSLEDEADILEVCEALGEDPIPYEERAKEHTTVYVEKTAEELRQDDLIADKILEYCRPEKLGGIAVSMPIFSSNDSMAHITMLLGNVPHSNYIDCLIAIANGGNE